MTNQRPLTNSYFENKIKLRPLLAKKLQQKSSGAGTLNSPMLMQERCKKALDEFVSALESSNLADSSYTIDQLFRFKTALKSNGGTTRIVTSSTKSDRVLECSEATDEVECDRKIRESIVFDFGDDYGKRGYSDLDDDFFYGNLDPNLTDNVAFDNICLTEIEDRKYGRDEIYRLSPLTKEDLEFFTSQGEKSLSTISGLLGNSCNPTSCAFF